MIRNTGLYSAVNPDNAVDWDHPLNRGRVAWWLSPPGVPGSGSRLLDLAGRNHGTLSGQTAALPMWGGTKRSPDESQSIEFNGTDQGVSCGTKAIVTSGQITVACWAKMKVTTRGDLVTKWLAGTLAGDQFNLLYGLTSAKPQFFVSSGSSTGNSNAAATSIVVGSWYRIVGTYTGAVCSVYMNGNLESSSSVSVALNADSGRTIWLGRNDQSDGYASAFISDATIWSRALTPAEIAADYRISSSGYRSPDSPLRWVSTKRYLLPSRR